MGDVSAPSLIKVVFLSRLGFSWLGLRGRERTTRHHLGTGPHHRAAVIGVPACTAQVTYRLIFGR